MNKRYTFNATVWLYPGESAHWHFVTLPKALAVGIRAVVGPRRGFGSVPVTVTMRRVEWQTSIFPDKISKSYLLPLKAAVRKSEGIEAGDVISVSIQLR